MRKMLNFSFISWIYIDINLIQIKQTKKIKNKMEIEENPNEYQVIVANIFWNHSNKKTNKKKSDEELPAQMSLTIPDQVLMQAKKNNNSFNDIVEQFCYNLLTRKYGCEVNSCQIWLPLDK